MSTAVLISSILLGLALATNCGFRVFLPLLGACLAARFHLIPLQSDFEWLSSKTALIFFAMATTAEIFVYYIPWFDYLLDTLTLPLAIVAGALLSTSILPIHDPMIRWALGLICGGAVAGIVHASTRLLRLFFSKTTFGTGNYMTATAENCAAAGGTLLSIFLPVTAGIIAIVLVCWMGIKCLRKVYPHHSH